MAPHPVAVTRVEQVLRDVSAALAARERRFALVGGLAVSARAEPRFTRDVDLAVVVADDSDAEALIHNLVVVGYSILAAIEQDAVGRLATVRLAPPGAGVAGVVADLLLASSGIEPEVVAEAEELQILPGLTLPVATVGHLVALKTLSHGPNRPQDLVDLRALALVAKQSDWQVARDALALIEARGFNRGKRLQEELARLFPASPPL